MACGSFTIVFALSCLAVTAVGGTQEEGIAELGVSSRGVDVCEAGTCGGDEVVALQTRMQKEDFVVEDEEEVGTTPDADQRAQEAALVGKCDLAGIAKKTKAAVEKLDANNDGRLSSDELQTGSATGDVLIGDVLADILSQTLGEASEKICAQDALQESTLGDSLCKELKDITSEDSVSAEDLERCAALAKPAAEPDLPSEDLVAVQVAQTNVEDAQDAREEKEYLAFLDATSKYNASVFKTMKKGQKKVGGEIAWAAVMKAINKLFVSDYCWKDVWPRGMAGRICKSGWYQSGLLCYRHCSSGYRRFGEHCWQDCPSGFNDVGGWCQREYWGECCTNTWFGRACVSCPRIDTRGKDVKHSPSCTLTSGTCSTCPHDHYAWGASCYRNAKPGYRCSGGELTCHRDCTDPIGLDCGGACALDTASCLSNTAEMVMGVIESAISIAMMAMTFGASSGATAMSSATKASMLKQAKKMSAKNAIRVAKQKFKEELKDGYKKVAWKAITKMKGQIADGVKGKIEEKKWELIAAYSYSESETIAEHYMAKTEKEGKDPALIVVKDIDPTGIASAIDKTADSDASDNSKAAAWMDVMSIADPTGILGAVANFVKHNHCESTIGKMNDIENEEINSPSMEDWGCKKYTGWISGGDNVALEWMQPKDAFAYCANKDTCKGFTMSGSPGTNENTWIYFKSKWDNYGSGWTSYKCD